MGSLIEAGMSTVIGFLLNLILSPIVYPIFGHSFTMGQNVGIALLFTVISIARGYVIRRWFNGRIKRAAQRMAAALS